MYVFSFMTLEPGYLFNQVKFGEGIEYALSCALS
jgi:hypothetical protein